MSEQELIIEQPHSTEISVNAKGLWSGKVKVYAQTPTEAYDTALKLAKTLSEVIKIKNGE